VLFRCFFSIKVPLFLKALYAAFIPGRINPWDMQPLITRLYHLIWPAKNESFTILVSSVLFYFWRKVVRISIAYPGTNIITTFSKPGIVAVTPLSVYSSGNESLKIHVDTFHHVFQPRALKIIDAESFISKHRFILSSILGQYLDTIDLTFYQLNIGFYPKACFKTFVELPQ